MLPFVKNNPHDSKWIALFCLWSIHGALAFWQFQASSALKESSLAYFAVRVLLITWIIINFIFISMVCRRVLLWLKWTEIFARSKTREILLIVASFLFIFRFCLWIFQKLLAPPLSQQVGGYLNLLTPVLELIGYISFEVAILILFQNLRSNLDYKQPFRKYALSALFVFSILGIIIFIISITGLGILPTYKGDWQRGLPAVALLEWQILLACALGLGVFFAELKLKAVDFPYMEVLICIAIWLGTSVFWLSQPVIPNASALKPREPNYEIYPFNDAQVYDGFAQSALVGNGFGDNVIPQRPLYAVFLIFLHVLAGQDYTHIIFFQTLVFAMFPVMLYLFGREFFGRPIGVSIALLAILRDYTSNLVSPFTGNLSYSKLYLSEIPTTILLILFLLVGLHWVKTGFPLFSGFLLGGILGTAMLIRTQVIVALPVIILIGFLQQKKAATFIKSILYMLVTVVLVAAPWLWRNWNLTGEFIFDNPESQTANLALRYGMLNGSTPEIMRLTGESTTEYSTRLTKIAKDAITSNPLKAAWAVSNAFLNHAVNNILLFPVRNNLHNMNELWMPSDAFWEGWEGHPTFSQSILIAFYIFLFGLGVTTAWIRNRWLGILPLAINLAYNFWTSLALLSGQRFMVTMDWSIYMYYMIGIFTLAGSFLFVLDSRRSVIVEWVKTYNFKVAVPAPAVRWDKYLMFGLLFFGIGLSLPLSEKIFPNRYPLLPQKVLVADLLTSSLLNQPGFDSVCFQKLANANELIILQGRANYPRYYAAGEGEKFTDSFGYKAVDESRLVFELTGQAIGRYILNTTQKPDYFPNASDVTLITSRNGELWFVFIKQGMAERFYISSSFDPLVCK